jgi:hypothetical protein
VQQRMWMRKEAKEKWMKVYANHDLALQYVCRHFGELYGEVEAFVWHNREDNLSRSKILKQDKIEYFLNLN